MTAPRLDGAEAIAAYLGKPARWVYQARERRWRVPIRKADGLGLYRGVVPFPHGSRRLRLDDRDRVSLLAHRVAPRQAVLLPDGSRLDLREGQPLPAHALTLGVAGRVRSGEAA